MAPRETTSMLMQNLGGQTKSIMVCYGISGVVNYETLRQKFKIGLCHGSCLVHSVNHSKTPQLRTWILRTR